MLKWHKLQVTSSLFFIQRIPSYFMMSYCRNILVAIFCSALFVLVLHVVKWGVPMTACALKRTTETTIPRESMGMTFSNMLTVPLADYLQESVFFSFTSKSDAELYDSPILLTGLSVLWRLTHFLYLNKIVKVDIKYYFAIVIRIALNADINSEF